MFAMKLKEWKKVFGKHFVVGEIEKNSFYGKDVSQIYIDGGCAGWHFVQTNDDYFRPMNDDEYSEYMEKQK
ncbi:MAG: hypothetical protein IKC47_03720 [Clostridia bacterium]|nr:hypothetical protein [Clostridia bacterium]